MGFIDEPTNLPTLPSISSKRGHDPANARATTTNPRRLAPPPHPRPPRTVRRPRGRRLRRTASTSHRTTPCLSSTGPTPGIEGAGEVVSPPEPNAHDVARVEPGGGRRGGTSKGVGRRWTTKGGGSPSFLPGGMLDTATPLAESYRGPTSEDLSPSSHNWARQNERTGGDRTAFPRVETVVDTEGRRANSSSSRRHHDQGWRRTTRTAPRPRVDAYAGGGRAKGQTADP